MKAAFIGVGMMGAPMCLNLLKKGHDVTAVDLNSQHLVRVKGGGASTAPTPAEAAAHADFIFTSLPMPADVERVLTGPKGVLEGARPGTIVVDLSTNAPSAVKRLAATLAEKQVILLDGPVSGGVEGAEKATLAIMCGGPQEAFKRVKPLLECMGGNVFLVGPIGSGSVAKLCNNLTSFANLAVACESMLLASRAGLDPEVMGQVMQASSGASFALKRVQRKGLRGDWKQEFTIDLSYKDLSLALDLGRETGTPLSMGSLTYTLLQQARAKGWGGSDLVSVLRLLEEAVGSPVRARP
ncbi:MAG: NAD(P)-dependent oxidoreductase [Deltaproteobacteria bacterium]|nr:NAD(P)-dependent oxidoreductase [Deltaproteobacteria bacterium]